MSYPIPDAALDDRLGFIGTSGSGKTYNAGGGVERLLASGARVVIVDPLGVWWGLRLLADGKTSSPFDVAIFGGPHGDLPLNEHVGALIGETAATMAESCIIDLSELGTKAADRRFMTAFLETIFRKATTEPFHLIVDESDLFAPQKPSKGDEVLLGLMEQIVRRGRVKGFIPWLISQRPAVLNKNVLSQVDALIAFKLTASQDRDALDAWIEGQADKAQGRAIKDSLPALPIGTGVVWLPGRAILETAAFPPKLTFDSSRTPKRGEKRQRRDLKPLDLGKLKERLATVEQEAKANDPRALKAEVARLTRELAAAKRIVPGEAPAWPDQREEVKALEQSGKEMWARVNALERRISAAVAALSTEDLPAIPAPAPPQRRPTPGPAPVQRQPAPVREARQSEGEPSTDLNAAAVTLAGLLKGLPGCEAAWTSLLILGGFRPGSGWIRKSEKQLIELGLLTNVHGDTRGTDALVNSSIEPIYQPSPAEVRALWRDKLRGPGGAIATWLAENGPATREEVAEGIGMSATAGWSRKGFKDVLGSNLAHEVGNGQLAAHPLLVD